MIAGTYNQLTKEINGALLGASPDLEEEEVAYARETFTEFLKEEIKCKSECGNLGSHCRGYEYYSDDRKCEITRVSVAQCDFP